MYPQTLIYKVAAASDVMCTRGGKVGNAILLGFKIGEMRTKFRNSTVTLNACSVCHGFSQPRIPPAACGLPLCCLDGSIGSVSSIALLILRRLERAHQFQSSNNGRAYAVTSSAISWPERDVLAVLDMLEEPDTELIEDRVSQRRAQVPSGR